MQGSRIHLPAQERLSFMLSQPKPVCSPENSHIETNKPIRVAVVGAGCTGLRIALLFKKLNQNGMVQRPVEVVIFEKRSEVGGFLQTRKNSSGLLVESGAQGVLSSRTIFLRALEDIGLQPKDVITPPTQKQHATRYVIAPSGRIAPLSANPFSLWKNGLLSPLQILRLIAEFFLSRQNTPPNPNENLYDFFKRHFGRACAENFLLPFATGIWGGGAQKLLARHAFPRLSQIDLAHGSLLRFAFFSFIAKLLKKQTVEPSLRYSWPRGLLSFPNGMQTLIEKMRDKLKESASLITIRVNSPVQKIELDTAGKLIINEKEDDSFDSIFWTTSPWSTPDLVFANKDAELEWENLQNTPTHHLIVVNVSGQRDPATRDGFGVLARRESSGLLGVLFVHSIYPQHVPANLFSYRILLAGDRNPEMISWSDESLKTYCLQQLKTLNLLTNHESVSEIEIVRWPRAIGIADHEHDARMNSLWRLEAHFPELRFAGIYKKGVGVADALLSAEEAFEAWLSVPRPNR